MSALRRAWIVWSVGLAAYVVTVMHRTTFGVAGLEAADRFSMSAGVLSSFVVLQLLVYVSLQVPIGLLLDRFGARNLIVTGALLMVAGQVALALAMSVPQAIVGRVLVGAGDALTFVSVLRVVAAWFPGRRVPLMTQLTSLVGQIGQVLSAVPFVALLQSFGWSPAFGSAAALGVVVALLALAVLRDSADAGATPLQHPSMRHFGREMTAAWRHPGTRLGLWTHFVTQFSATAFAMLWGFPFLVAGQGLSPEAAGALITVLVGVGVIAGPVIGVLVQRYPHGRSGMVFGLVVVLATVWALVLLWPGPAPTWLLVVLVTALAWCGPVSMIGFDFARTFNPPSRLGAATGIVNLGGSSSSLLAILAIGLVLEARTGDEAEYALADFRVALSVQYAMWIVCTVGILRTRRLVRRRMAEGGMIVPPMRDVLTRRSLLSRSRRG